MGLIPDEIIEAVRLRSDIVEVVSRYVQLKKRGKYFVGPCPFHQERAPSFTVTPGKQIFHCFGCRAGGDVFRFMMQIENLTFNDALGVLAQQAGIIIPVAESRWQEEKGNKAYLFKQINETARDFFHQTLFSHQVAGRARSYLARRGFVAETLKHFQVGYALPARCTLIDYLGKEGFRPEDVAEAGLALKSETGKHFFDRFRNRIILPIWDSTGQVVGFGGRVVDDSQPKYINSPETSFFNKGRILYALHLARSAIREKGHVVVVEGYLDVITAYQHGVTNVVATLGTALSSEQGRLLGNYSKNIVVAYDADSAGLAATMRGLDILQEMECQVRVVTIPEGQDPDDFLRNKGHGQWDNLVEQAPSLIEYRLKQAASRSNVINTAAKLELAKQIFKGLIIKSDIEIEDGLKTVARELSLSWEAVVGEFKRFQENSSKKRLKTDIIAKSKHNIFGEGARVSARHKAESVILRLILEDPSLSRLVQEKMGDEPFKSEINQKIFNLCMKVVSEKDTFRPFDLFCYLTAEEQTVLSKILVEDIPGEDPVKILTAHIDSIFRYDRQEQRAFLLKKISEAEKAGQKNIVNDILQELTVLQKTHKTEKENLS